MFWGQGWVFLIAAISFEVAGTTMMKLSDGFAHIVPSVLTFVFYAGSLTALTMALKHIDIGVAYAVWSGLGTLSIVLIGVVFFQEPATIQKALSILLIIVGVAALNYFCNVH